jgi:hypothetical protein
MIAQFELDPPFESLRSFRALGGEDSCAVSEMGDAGPGATHVRDLATQLLQMEASSPAHSHFTLRCLHS